MKGGPRGLYLLLLSALFTLRLSAGQQSSPPQFLTHPSNVTAFRSTTLPCAASGTPTPTITWLRDGSPLDVTTTPGLTKTATGLQISGLQDDGGEGLEGEYQCVATNQLGAVRSQPAMVTRTVWDVPPPANSADTVLRYTHVALTCVTSARSVPPAVVTWQPATPPELVTALDGRLHFTAIDHSRQFRLQQMYMCTVSNPVSSQTVQRSITLTDAPRLNGVDADIRHDTEVVVGPAAHQSLVVGETLTLECITSGNPVVDTTTWTHNGSPLIIGGRVSTSQAGRHLVVAMVEPQDAGTYTCRGAPSRGSTVTASGDVEIIVPPAITTAFPSTPANASQNISVTCTSEGTAPLTWEWLHDGVELVSSERVAYQRQGHTSTLTLSVLEEGDGGVYQCVARQPATGQLAAHHQLIDVRVVAPVHLTSLPYPDVLALEGTTITIPCLAMGFPPPTFSWVTLQSSTQSLPVPLDTRHSIPPAGTGDGSLTISPVTIADSSSLACIATNSPGNEVRGDRVMLSVIAMPTVLMRPGAALTPPSGSMVTIPCSATPLAGGTSIRYRWTRDGQIIGPESRDDGTLIIPAIRGDQSDNGLYECSLVVEKSGLDAAPLVIPVASTVVTVGEPPSAPSPPTPHHPITTAATIAAEWTAPQDNGGLPILNYTLELLNRGSTLCPRMDPEWEVVRSGIEPGVSEVVIREGVYPAMDYQFRVTVFTSVFSTVSQPSPMFTTPHTVPGDPPTNLQVVVASSNQLNISWAAPTSCLNYGGPLLGYRIQYRYRLQGAAFVTNEVDIPLASVGYSLSDLSPNTAYEVEVALRNAAGVGQAAAVSETTLPAPPLPLTAPTLTVAVVNSSAVALSWEAPSSLAGREILGYDLVYTRPDGTLSNPALEEGRLNFTITDLSPGTHTFNISARYRQGLGPADSVSVLLEGEAVSEGVVGQPWFYALIGGAGVVMVVLIIILLLCICYQLCCRKDKVGGKHRGTFVVSATSNHFSEYTRKGKSKGNTMPHVVVHSSPTPSRRSTDYAVPTLRTSHPIPPSTGPPSSAHPSTVNLTSSAMSSPQFSARNAFYHSNGNPFNQQNGNAPMNRHENLPMDRLQFHPYRDMTPELSFEENVSTPELDRIGNHMTNAEHIRQVSATTSQKFVDTLSRVHTPPLSKANQQFSSTSPTKSPTHHAPPPSHFSSSYLARAASQDIDEPPWNPAEMLNARGHMTNNPVGRSDSHRSTESSNSMEFRGPSQLTGEYRIPLSPLTEGHFAADNGGGRSRAFTNGDGAHGFREEVDGRARAFTEMSHDGGTRGSHDFRGDGRPHPHTHRGQRSQGHSEKDGRSYLTEVDVITSGLNGGQSSSGMGHNSGEWRMRDSIDMPHRATPLGAHREGFRGEGRAGPHHGQAEGRMASYEPKVHVSYSKAVSQRPPSPTLSESGYAIPPSSKLAPSKPQGEVVYNHPAPAYAAPPPPEEDEDLTTPSPPPHLQGLISQYMDEQLPPHGYGVPRTLSPPTGGPAAPSSAPPPDTSTAPLPVRPLPNTSRGLTATVPPPNSSRRLMALPPASQPPKTTRNPPPATRGLTVLPSRSLSSPNPPMSTADTEDKRLRLKPLNAPLAQTFSPPTTFSPPRTFSLSAMPPAHQGPGTSREGATSPPNGHVMSGRLPPAYRPPPDAHPTAGGIGVQTRLGATSPQEVHIHQRSASVESTSSHTSSEVRRLHMIPMDGGVRPLGLQQNNSSDQSLNNSLDGSIGSGWSLDKIQRSMEQKANTFDNMLTPLQEGVEATPTPDHMTRVNDTPALMKAVPVKAPKPPTLPKPPPAVAAKPHQRLPKTTSPPPDIVPTTTGYHGYRSSNHSNHDHNSARHSNSGRYDHNNHHSNSSSHNSCSSNDEDPASIAINKKRPKVPDLTTMDPRKPKLKVKKVPRSVWQPRPMNGAIQSSSSESESDCSDYSVDTVVGPGDTSTLRSAHV